MKIIKIVKITKAIKITKTTVVIITILQFIIILHMETCRARFCSACHRHSCHHHHFHYPTHAHDWQGARAQSCPAPPRTRGNQTWIAFKMIIMLL